MFSSGPVIHVNGATIFQDHNSILTDLSFEIQKSEFSFLVGRTGSGKSSLLKTFYADLPLRLGDISVAGFNIRDIKSHEVSLLRRKIGIIFQDFQLFPDRTVGENLNFVMKATGWKEGPKTKAGLPKGSFKVGWGAGEKKCRINVQVANSNRGSFARGLVMDP